MNRDTFKRVLAIEAAGAGLAADAGMAPPPRMHHPHGPSAIGNPCDAAPKLCRLPLPAMPASDDADEGTMLHALVANPEPAKLAELDSEQAMAVGQCLTQALAWAESLGCLRPYTEQMLSLYDEAGELVNFGTLDYLAISPDGKRAILADWKFGRNASPLVADQLACYAAMAFQAHPDLLTIEAHAWYPRAARHSQAWGYERADLPRLIEAIKARIAIRESADHYTYVTGDHCSYCPAAVICGARRKELATVESAAITVESLAPVEIADLLPRLKRVEKISDAIKARAKVLAGSGELPGWRLVDVRGREQLDGTPADVAAELHLAGWSPDDLWSAVKFDLAALRKIAKAKPVPPGETRKPEEYHLSSVARLIGRAAGYQKLVETKEEKQ